MEGEECVCVSQKARDVTVADTGSKRERDILVREARARKKLGSQARCAGLEQEKPYFKFKH